MNIPVTQIVEEITDREYTSYTDCGRDPVSKSSIEWRSIQNIYFVGIKVFLG